MTTKIDGTNGVLQSYDYQVLTTGFSYTFASGITTLLAQPAGTLATGTITMPGSPADGMVVTIESTQQVTAVTVQGNSGQTLTGAPSQLIPNQPLSFIYRQANTTWYAMAGGAGRATALVSGTAVASTSGTSIDFTGIPSWVKRVTVMLSGVSTSGTSNLLVQLGDSGGIENTGYTCGSGIMLNAASSSTVNSTAGFIIITGSASNVNHALITISLVDATTNTWSAGYSYALSNSAVAGAGSGSKSLSATLTQARITTVNGTDTFDAGSINILYE